jgi:exopolysaccharide production protein ExoQ
VNKSTLRDIFTIFVIIFMTSPYFPWYGKSGNSIDISEGNLVTQILKYGIYLIIFCMFLPRLKLVFRSGANNLLIWLVVIWAFASFFWSVDPSITLRRAVGLLGASLIGLYIASFYSVEKILRIAGWSFLIINLLSMVTVIFFPSRGIMSNPYGWEGIYSHKNILGRIAYMGITLFPVLLRNEKRRLPWIIGFILSSILLVGSNSTTSLIISFLALFIWFTIFAYQNRSRLLFIFIIWDSLLVAIWGIWLYFTENIDFIFSIFGKDFTLTGRTEIWKLVLAVIRQRPWIGYGYSAIWLGTDAGMGSYIMGQTYGLPAHAHNGFLEICLEIGLIGVILVSVLLINLLSKWLLTMKNSIQMNGYYFFPVVLLTSLILYNFTESTLLTPDNISWVFIAIWSFALPKIQSHFIPKVS